MRYFFDLRRKKSHEPIIDNLEFLRLTPFSRTICDVIYKAFTNGASNIAR